MVGRPYGFSYAGSCWRTARVRELNSGEVIIIISYYCPDEAAFSPPSLLQCFDITSETRVIALVGGGGKTSLMYRLVEEMRSLGETVITTTTTKIFRPEARRSPRVILQESDPDLLNLPSGLAEYGHVTVAHSFNSANGKLHGVDDEVIDRCSAIAQRVVVEADGAARRPIKAPETWEPVIPRGVDLVIPVVGLDCIGRPATSDVVFRLERFSAIAGVLEGAPITAEAVGRLLSHPYGSLKGVPDGVFVTPLLNKLDLLENQGIVDRIARTVRAHAFGRVERMVVGSLLYGRSGYLLPRDRSP